MSRGVNKWIGIGNCCADPVVRRSAAGSAVVSVAIACNDSYKDKNAGRVVDKTEFVQVVFFNKLAEIAGEYLKKGSKVYIEGSLRTRQWEKDGQKHYTTEIVANEMQMLGGRPEADRKAVDPAAARAYRDASGGSTKPAEQPAPFNYFDDTPF